MYNITDNRKERQNMKIAIVDDESDARQHLQELVTQWGISRECPLEFHCFDGAETFVQALAPGKFHLVFMDIYMNGADGLNAARQLWKLDRNCLTVFLTSSDAHRGDAFSVHAFDYLEKPLAESALLRTLDDARLLLEPQQQPYLELPQGKSTLRLLCSDIRCVTADLQYCLIYAGQVHRVRIPFRELQELLLQHKRFLSINRGILVNMDYVQSMEGTVCQMADGSIFPLHTKRTAAIRQAFIDYQFAKRTEAMVGRPIL